MTNTEDSSKIGQLFEACDLDGSGFIDEEELKNICPELSGEEVSEVFKELDQDGDGKISIAEFSDGFKGISDTLLAISRARRERLSSSTERLENSEKEKDLQGFVGNLDEGFGALTCQEQVCDLYQQLHSAEMPHLLNQFENIIYNVIKDVRQQQYENDRLERSFKREKEQHEKHLRQLEEETEHQMSKVECRVRNEVQEKFEDEKNSLKQQLETEIGDLQSNLKRLQKLESQCTERPNGEEKNRVEELSQENRYLKSHLTDAQTNLALLRSELTTIRQGYDDKCYELQHEKEALSDYIRDHDSLSSQIRALHEKEALDEYINDQTSMRRQILLLHDANKKLHDTNDDLRSALENTRAAHKRSHSGGPRSISPVSVRSAGSTRKGSILSEYMLDLETRPRPRSANANLAQELSSTETLLASGDSVRRLLPSQESAEVESLPDDFGQGQDVHSSDSLHFAWPTDSGHSTLRDMHEVDSEYEPNSLEDDIQYTPRKRNRRTRRGELDSTTESELPESQDEMETDLNGDELDDCRPQSSCSRSSSRASGHSRTSNHSQGSQRKSIRRQLPPIPIRHITAEPERMYKVVLAGDAAVGKSSFILRLCKNKFVPNLNSTLGVDFQTKTIEVDGRVIALQLWDTAGQERFRSIAKSYFRRADGVLLLYDCTYERSFLNVREWAEVVEDGSKKNIAMMLVGNKTDLREQLEEEGSSKRLVRREEGQRLAKEFNSLFIETSAKDGSNIMEAVIEMARLLRTNEDLEVQNVGMQLQELKTAESKKSCCK